MKSTRIENLQIIQSQYTMKGIKITFSFLLLSLFAFSQTVTNHIGSSGNVGINNLNPAYPLYVNDPYAYNSVTAYFGRQGTDGCWIGSGNYWTPYEYGLYDGGGDLPMVVYDPAVGNIHIGWNLVESIDGTVGIGTQTPIASLTIKGQNSSWGLLALQDYWNSGAGASIDLAFFGADENKIAHLGPSGGNFIIQNDQSNKVLLSPSNGKVIIGTNTDYGQTLQVYGTTFLSENVGIGTTDPKGYRLAVNGDAIFTKVKVKAYSIWPDYVFHANYKLPPLQKVESCIKANKHLPGVPSAEEVAKEGLDLGENQAILLKKIEELTLYVIKQQKQINTLQKQVSRAAARTVKPKLALHKATIKQ